MARKPKRRPWRPSRMAERMGLSPRGGKTARNPTGLFLLTGTKKARRFTTMKTDLFGHTTASRKANRLERESVGLTTSQFITSGHLSHTALISRRWTEYCIVDCLVTQCILSAERDRAADERNKIRAVRNAKSQLSVCGRTDFSMRVLLRV